MRRQSNQILIDRLKEAASFERASFDRLGPGAGTVTIKEGEVTEFIRERTKLYRETWIIPVIEQIEERLCKPRKRKN